MPKKGIISIVKKGLENALRRHKKKDMQFCIFFHFPKYLTKHYPKLLKDCSKPCRLDKKHTATSAGENLWGIDTDWAKVCI